MKAFKYLFIISLIVTSLNGISCRNDEGIKAGVILPLSGDGASYGKKELNGINLAIEEYNSKYTNRKIRIIVEDSGGKSSTATLAANKLIYKDEVKIIIGDAFSSPTLAIVPITTRNKVLLISPTASSPKLSNSSPYFFRIWPSDLAEAEDIAELVVNQLKYKRIAVFNVNNDYGLGLKEAFIKKIIKEGGKIVFNDAYNEGQRDFRTPLLKIKLSSADAVYIPGYYKESSNILIQARQLGIKCNFFGSATINEPELLKLTGNASENLVFLQPDFDIKNPNYKQREFMQKYSAKFTDQAGIYAAHGYDAAKILAGLIEENIFGIEKMRNKLLNTKYEGVTGSIKFEKSGDCKKSIKIMTIKNGQFVSMEDL